MLGVIGAMVGLLIGGSLGMAVGGPLGAALGGLFGAGLGHLTMMIFGAAYATEAARRPQTVICPDTGQRVKVQLDPKRQGWAAVGLARPLVQVCARWKGTPQCPRWCEEKPINLQ